MKARLTNYPRRPRLQQAQQGDGVANCGQGRAAHHLAHGSAQTPTCRVLGHQRRVPARRSVRPRRQLGSEADTTALH
eukprot:1702826-Heterocapsa_arctica.AAC.1